MASLARKRRIFIIVGLAIPVILLILFVVYPAANLFGMSLTDWDGMSAVKKFVGIQNYIDMFTKSPDLWLSLRNNGIYLAVHMLMIPVEMGIAVMLNGKMRGKSIVKSIIFLPFIISGVGISYAFSYFFSPVNGAFNEVLSVIGLEGLVKNWLSDPNIVNFVLAFVSVWRYSGYHVVLFIAGLKSVPIEVLEAAQIDGANAWHKFRYIQIPMIGLVLDFVLFDCIRGTLQHFEIPFVMTQGGPGYASSTFTLYTIDTAFKFDDFGMAATMAVAIMIIVMMIYLIQHMVSGVLNKKRG